MNIILRKEIRQTGPGFGLALALACALWFLPDGYDQGPLVLLGMVPFVLCPMVVAFASLDVFGREVNTGTWTLLLSQPVPRALIWRTKVSALGLGIASVLVVWIGPVVMRSSVLLSEVKLWECVLGASAFALSLGSGALWTVLLLRHVTAAFWFTALIPGLLMVMSALLMRERPEAFWPVCSAVLFVYSVAGFFAARHLFLHAQDVQWSGGTVTIPRFDRLLAGASSTERRYRPWAALVLKEIRLQQSHFVLAGLMACVHVVLRIVGALAADKLSQWPAVEVLVTQFWAFWFVMPILIGAQAVAEERTLGTLEGQLCLPVRPGVQLAIKFAVVIALSYLIGLVLPLALEAGRHQDWSLPLLLQMCIVPLTWSLLACYASSISRSTLQSLAPAAAAIVTFWLLILGGLQGVTIAGTTLWQGWLIVWIGTPVLVLTALVLMAWNWRQGRIDGSVWRHNGLVWAGSIGFLAVSVALIYNRAWELVAGAEPSHGPARLAGPLPCRIQGNAVSMLVQVPDGRYWLNQYTSQSESLAAQLFGGYRPVELLNGGRWISGTNWSQLTLSGSEVVGIAKDGSLWVSAGRILQRPGPGTRLPDPGPISMERVGEDTDWLQLAEMHIPTRLLKRDGTLWRLGAPPRRSAKDAPLELRNVRPVLCSKESDWAAIVSSPFGMNLIKRDGSVWTTSFYGARRAEARTLDDQTPLYRVEGFETKPWRSLAWVNLPGAPGLLMGISTNGVFRIAASWGQRPSAMGWEVVPDDRQVGAEGNWLDMARNWSGTRPVTLRSDGTLWQWRLQRSTASQPESTRANRFSRHADWLAIHELFDGFVAVAADGGLHYWGLDTMAQRRSENSWAPLLGPSRVPIVLGNIAAAASP